MQKKLNIPSKATLRKLYSAFANLYGMINWEDAYVIINKFFPDFEKKDFLKDLKNRSDKYAQEYQVYTVRDKKDGYVIGDHFDKEEEMIELYKSQGSLPFWLADTLDEYLKYANLKWYQNTEVGKEILEWFFKNIPLSHNKRYQWLFDIFRNIDKELDYEDTLSLLKSHGLELKDKTSEFMELYIKFVNNIKLRRLRGHTINELAELAKNSEVVQLPDDEPYTKPKSDDTSNDSEDIIWLREWLKKRRM